MKRLFDVFCEDSGHDTFPRNLIKVLANTVSIANPELHIHSARAGHVRAIHSLKAWQRAARDYHQPHGDALLVMIDANNIGWQPMLRRIQDAVDLSLYPDVIIACPDPHYESRAICVAGWPQGFKVVEVVAHHLPVPA